MRRNDPWEDAGSGIGLGAARFLLQAGAGWACIWGLARRFAHTGGLRSIDRVVALEALGFVRGDSPSEAQIARTFRVVAKSCHPDASNEPGAVEQFMQAAAARDLLLSHRART